MLYGRDVQRTLIGDLLGAARTSRSGCLVVRGEPGAGKTALLEDARERAPDMLVLTARGIQSDSELPFAGLHDLLRPALPLDGRLPAPQADALNGALGLAANPPASRFLVSFACLTLLTELAGLRPVLCLVDDVHWLDTPSADALLFVARRLDVEGIVLLFATREGDVRDFGGRDLPATALAGLDAEDATALIGRGAGGTVAPAVRDLLLERAGGNALALVELSAALTPAQLAGDEPVPHDLPPTRDVERLFAERVRRLPDEGRQLMAIAALDETGRLSAVMRAADSVGVTVLDALGDAEGAGLLAVHGTSVEMCHPLVRSAIVQSWSSGERHVAHLALAAALTDDLDDDQRTWHRAGAALGPDPEVAAELDDAAQRAQARSAHAAAATALQRAAELTTDAAAGGRRLVGAAGAAWQAGQPGRASALLDRAGPLIAAPLLRADVDHLRGAIEFRRGRLPDAAATLLRGAVSVAAYDTRKALTMLFDAGRAGVDAGDHGLVARAAQLAAELPSNGDEADVFLADLLVGGAAVLDGRPASEVALLEDIVARSDDWDEPRWLVWAAAAAGAAGDEAREAEILRRAVALARASAAVDTLALVLLSVTVNGVLSSRPGVAAEAREGLGLAREADLPNAELGYHAVLAWIAGVQGRDDECRGCAAEIRSSAREVGAGLARAIAEWGVALLDLGRGRFDATVSRLAALRDAPPGIGHPLVALSSTADLVEACARSGRREEAEAAFAALAGFAGPGAPAWALAAAARCRGLLAQDDSAEVEFAEALHLYGECDRPLDRARTELLFGEHLRRRRRRVESREPLRAALETFEALGAAAWAARARAELRAAGETARRGDRGGIEHLTPQELQVARFVAGGLSDQEVAAGLFLSPRTIEARLRSVFAKLGVTSRAQLAGLPLAGDEPRAVAGQATSA